MSVIAHIKSGQVGHLDLEGYVTADDGTLVRDLLVQMRRFDRTTALLTREGRLSGIFTERDVLQQVLTQPETLDRPVRELMTAGPTMLHPGETVLEALRKMNEGHFRDLPVVSAEGKILGNLTDNAIVRFIADHMPAEVLNLPPDPDQVPRTPEGA